MNSASIRNPKNLKTKIFLSELIRKPGTIKNLLQDKQLVVPPINSVTKKKQSELFVEYFDCILSLINHDQVQELSKFLQHGSSNRLQHSLNVSYYAYLIAKKLDLDYRSAARGGLLHDMFFYYSKDKKHEPGSHIFAHPKAALENAQSLFDLNEKEKEIIICHMFPLCVGFPKHIESHIVSIADKGCAIHEGLLHAFRKSRKFISRKRAVSTI